MFGPENVVRSALYLRGFTKLLALIICVVVICIIQEEKVSSFIQAGVPRVVPIYNIPNTRMKNNSTCLNTSTDPSFIICTHDAKEDIFISKSLQSSGLWDPKMTKLLKNILNQNENVTVVDIGANIGYFSLLAAALGHSALAIEPIERNLQKIAQSVRLNNFQDKITILNSVISHNRRQVELCLLSDTNQGSATILNEYKPLCNRNTIMSSSVVLDDLVDYINTKDIIIKLDIEGHECRAVEKSSVIFKAYNVLYVFTEWSKMTSNKHRYGIACPPERILQTSRMLARRGFIPYDIHHNRRLDPENSDRWRIDDIYWRYEREAY